MIGGNGYRCVKEGKTTYDLGLSLGELGLGSLELLSLSLPDVLSLLGLLSLAISGEKGKGEKSQPYGPLFQNADESRFRHERLTGKRWKRR